MTVTGWGGSGDVEEAAEDEFAVEAETEEEAAKKVAAMMCSRWDYEWFEVGDMTFVGSAS